MKKYQWCGWTSLALALCVATTSIRADETDVASAAPKPAAPDSPPPEKSAKAHTESFSPDEVIVDVLANSTEERLKRMDQNLHDNLPKRVLQDFIKRDRTLKSNDEREKYYDGLCEKYHIDC